MILDLIGNRTVADLLTERTARTPDKTWLVFESAQGSVTELTYAQFENLVAVTADGLSRHGVGRADRFLVHLDNSVEYLVCLFAAAYIGAIVVPSNTANTPGELAHVLTLSKPSLIVTSPQYLNAIEEALRDTALPVTQVVVGDAPGWLPWAELQSGIRREPVRLDSEEPLEIMFTSGTTSRPRGVVLTHANWLWSGERGSRGMHMEESDRFLACLPLFHVNAQSLSMLNALTSNATLILVPRFSATAYLDQVRRHRATHLSMVAMMVRTLLAQPASREDSNHAVRRVTYAINVTEAEMQEFESRFGMTLTNGYGLSEAMTEVIVSPLFGPRRWPSMGLPATGRLIRLVDDCGADVPLGAPGEIIIHGIPGRTIMKGYYEDPEATARTIQDGWLHTGDVAYQDEYGYLYFVDRVKDIIKRAGENISASEVESVIARHPAVGAVSVVAVPDAIRDEAVKACVVLRPGHVLDEASLREFCGQHLSSFKVPTIVEFRESLPMTSLGKIEKKLLREPFPGTGEVS